MYVDWSWEAKVQYMETVVEPVGVDGWSRVKKAQEAFKLSLL